MPDPPVNDRLSPGEASQRRRRACRRTDRASADGRDLPSDGTILGMTIPAPQSLIHMTLILCVLTFIYVSARPVGDDEYTRDFLATLIARNRYRYEPTQAR
jgi:hypothetical protein